MSWALQGWAGLWKVVVTLCFVAGGGQRLRLHCAVAGLRQGRGEHLLRGEGDPTVASLLAFLPSAPVHS